MVYNQFAKNDLHWSLMEYVGVYWGIVGVLDFYWGLLLGSIWVYLGTYNEAKDQSQTLFVVETFIAASNSRVERLNNQGAVTSLP